MTGSFEASLFSPPHLTLHLGKLIRKVRFYLLFPNHSNFCLCPHMGTFTLDPLLNHHIKISNPSFFSLLTQAMFISLWEVCFVLLRETHYRSDSLFIVSEYVSEIISLDSQSKFWVDVIPSRQGDHYTFPGILSEFCVYRECSIYACLMCNWRAFISFHFF